MTNANKTRFSESEEEEIKYDKKKMFKFIQQDLLLERVYKDLGADDEALEVVFNSYVYGDSIMEVMYKTL